MAMFKVLMITGIASISPALEDSGSVTVMGVYSDMTQCGAEASRMNEDRKTPDLRFECRDYSADIGR
jgi:hypothetical protein